jgi:hypothetical protein
MGPVRDSERFVSDRPERGSGPLRGPGGEHGTLAALLVGDRHLGGDKEGHVVGNSDALAAQLDRHRLGEHLDKGLQSYQESETWKGANLRLGVRGLRLALPQCLSLP